jgi:CRISPR-associated exonuclease Cas4
MQITGTHFNYYQVCRRKLWLFANNVNFEQTSDLVYDGKLIHEDSYPLRSSKYEEVEIDGIKVDYYDTKSKTIHEIKKSNKVEKAHEWQLKYYMYVFEQHGVTDVKGILEYSTLRKTQAVVLSDVDRDRIKEMVNDIEGIISSDDCPPLQKKGICKNCSYYEFCYTKETDE